MKNWLKLVGVIAIFACISVGLFFVCKLCGLSNLEGLKSFLQQNKQWSVLIFFCVEVLSFSLFCFIPIIEPSIKVLGIVLFGAKIAFFVSWAAEFVAASLMFFIGDKFGEGLARKLIGQEELERAQNLIDTKSKILLPIMFAVPGLPDDAISLVAGMTKMKYWFFAPICLAFCGCDIAILCFFGSGIINWATLSVFDYLVFANLILVDIYLLFKFDHFIEEKIKAKNKNNLISNTKEEKNNSQENIKKH